MPSSKPNANPLENNLLQYRKMAEENEKKLLFQYASFSHGHSRLNGVEDDHRLPYKRDVDRIIHSKAYARYSDKTQVVYLVDNDHITHRSLHVQLVSHFARGIAEILRLNLDLVEAISLGHDVGHPPFGHEGEGYLSSLSSEYANGPFNHPLQACHLFSNIEPLNLGLAVYDGFLCHDGGLCGRTLIPQPNKTWEIHFQERLQKKSDPEKNIMPGTLEGCLVKICDTVTYMSRDIEDAISLRLLNREDIPKTVLGTTRREFLSFLAADILKNSYDKNEIGISEASYEALKTLRQFNFKEIYNHKKIKVESSKIKESYRILFTWLLNDWKEKEKESYFWKNYLHKKSEKYRSETPLIQSVVDYLAGMTDNYFVHTLEKVFMPRKIELGV